MISGGGYKRGIGCRLVWVIFCCELRIKSRVGDRRDGPVSQAVLKAPVAEVRDLISTGAG